MRSEVQWLGLTLVVSAENRVALVIGNGAYLSVKGLPNPPNDAKLMAGTLTDLGFKVTNCQSCHVEKLPRKGAVTQNDRGKWLQEEKGKRKAKEVDAAWLKDYVEKKVEEKK